MLKNKHFKKVRSSLANLVLIKKIKKINKLLQFKIHIYLCCKRCIKCKLYFLTYQGLIKLFIYRLDGKILQK